MTERVWLREVGLRDGLQNIDIIMPTARKMAWCAAEHAAGVDEIEVTSLVPATLIPQFADAAAVVTQALNLPGLTVDALIPNLKGAERGLALGVHTLHYVLSVSESHNLANVRRSTCESIEDFRRVVALRDGGSRPRRTRVVGGLATAFGCTLEGAVEEKRVVALAEELLAAGADELTLADTVGYGNPQAVRALFRQIVDLAGTVPVSAHFHNTRGLGLANVVAALETGVRRFDASLGGLGGCPYAPGATGNIVMEDCAFMLEAMGLATGIDLDRLLALRRQVADDLAGVEFHGELARAGTPKNYLPVAAAPATR